MNWRLIMLVSAIVCFALATFGVTTKIDLKSLGLAFFAASFL